MEYEDLIEQAQQMSIDVPDTDAILSGMHRTMHRRLRQRQSVLSVLLFLGAFTTLFFAQPVGKSPLTLAERVSAHLDTPSNDTPAPLVGYQHSIRNRQIYTLR